ncbi:MAG: YjbQ family protein [Planctomycetes bacterium]|nr:YjbQ family protein [Planctomycetota bacterium]
MVIIPVSTSNRTELIDITGLVKEAVRKNKWVDGVLYIHVPHTTAGVTINEHADPAVREDIIEALNKLIPVRSSYRHSEGNSDAHIKTSLIGSSVMVSVEEGRLVLGRWQGVFFCEFDGPRRRETYLKFIVASA